MGPPAPRGGDPRVLEVGEQPEYQDQPEGDREQGGFLHADDNYGMNDSFRREMARLFPEQPLVEVPLDHPVYRLVYNFPRGIPKIHEHDGKPAQAFGIFLSGRLAVFYSFETDLGDGWEDAEVHRDSPERREEAIRMGVNLFAYAVGYGG